MKNKTALAFLSGKRQNKFPRGTSILFNTTYRSYYYREPENGCIQLAAYNLRKFKKYYKFTMTACFIPIDEKRPYFIFKLSKINNPKF